MLASYDFGGEPPCGSGLAEILGCVDTAVPPLTFAIRVHALEQDAVVVTARLDVFALAPQLVLRYMVDAHDVMRCNGGGLGLA